jgi:acylphosphatase
MTLGRNLDCRGSLTAMDRQRRRVIVTGRVQNVWYRDTCRTEALARGVAGWVHNCADGSVEAVFEGSPQAVQQMIAWCRSGPPRARVDNVEVIVEPVLNEAGFVVR